MKPAQLKLNLFTPRRAARYLAACLALLFSLVAWGTFTAAQGQPYAIEPVWISIQGRPITAYRFGSGQTHIAFIGGIHQGDESVSTDLINKAIEYYARDVAAIPPELTVFFIPNANPD